VWDIEYWGCIRAIRKLCSKMRLLHWLSGYTRQDGIKYVLEKKAGIAPIEEKML